MIVRTYEITDNREFKDKFKNEAMLLAQTKKCLTFNCCGAIGSS